MTELKSIEELFRGRHVDREVIILCVRWYLRYKLSFRDLVEMMSERGLHVAHTTILRWVQRYAPVAIPLTSPMRGDVKTKIPPCPLIQGASLACIQPNVGGAQAVCSPRIS